MIILNPPGVKTLLEGGPLSLRVGHIDQDCFWSGPKVKKNFNDSLIMIVIIKVQKYYLFGGQRTPYKDHRLPIHLSA